MSVFLEVRICLYAYVLFVYVCISCIGCIIGIYGICMYMYVYARIERIVCRTCIFSTAAAGAKGRESILTPSRCTTDAEGGYVTAGSGKVRIIKYYKQDFITVLLDFITVLLAIGLTN